MWLVVLTTFLTPLCVLISWNSIHDRVKEFFILLLVLETALIGVFVSLDLFLFYFFWEATLIPMALLIGMYGHGRQSVCRGEIFPVHHDRLGLHAGGDFVAVRQGRNLRFCDDSERHPQRAGAGVFRRGAVAVSGILHRLRRQSSAVPVSHLAAGRARRSADRGLGAAGRRAAEDGHIRNAALQPGAVSRSRRERMPRGSWCWR